MEKLFSNFEELISVEPPQVYIIHPTAILTIVIVMKGRLQLKTALLIDIVDPSDLFL